MSKLQQPDSAWIEEQEKLVRLFAIEEAENPELTNLPRNRGPVPDYVKEYRSKHGNLDVLDAPAALERAPIHMIEISEFYVGLNEEKIAELSALAGNARSEERDQRMNELRAKHADVWGKRGGPRKIVQRESRGRNPISLRTVQKYFKDSEK